MQTPTPIPNKPLTLAQLVALVESNNNQFAVRFETAYHPNPTYVGLMAGQSHISYHTAEILCACSFGKYQIMGNNLMDLGLQCSPIEYCSNSELQDLFFSRYCIKNNCAYLLSDIINDELKRNDFAKKYNGPGNIQAYSQRLMSFI